MARLNGIGTGFLGWRHRPDGVSTATLWFTVAYLPVIPLRRFRLRNLTDFDAERSPTVFETTAALLGGIAWTDPIEILDRLPLQWQEIVATYLRCYVLVPLLCLWPIALTRFVFGWLEGQGIVPSQEVVVAAALVNLAYVVFVLLESVRRMRGYPGSRLHGEPTSSAETDAMAS